MIRLLTKARRAVETLREEGLRSFAQKASSALGFREIHLLERPLADAIPAARAPAGCEIRPLGHHELDAYRALRSDAVRSVVASRIAGGCTCFGGWIDGQLVSVCWMGTRCFSPAHLGVELQIEPGEVVLFDAFTAPLQRGRCISPAVSAAILSHCKELGMTTALRFTVPWNRAALRAHAKAGFRPTCMVRVVGLGGWKRVSYRPPRTGASPMARR